MVDSGRGNHALIRTGETGDKAFYRLHFAEKAAEKPIVRYWTPARALPPAAKPLEGLHIALDPGHLGGKWARMEERWMRAPSGTVIQEGDMTLAVARLLAPRLQALGARVSLVRGSAQPVTKRRPKHFRERARQDLRRLGSTRPPATYAPNTPPQERWKSLQWHEEKYFYRTSEIRARAEKVNDRLKPDLVVCLHFNAEAWGDPAAPRLTDRNHLHLLVNGAYGMDELTHHDERFEMLLRLLQRTHEEELALAEAVSLSMARRTQLPAYTYTTNNVKRLGKNPYVYARNLLANRLYQCPVIYLEPYVMNHPAIIARVQAGKYEGVKEVAGRRCVNLYEEYAQGVLEGLVAYYREARRR